jgi:hypothetical protein
MLEVKKSPEGKKRVRNGEKCDKSGLIVTLKGFRPQDVDSERRRRAGDVPSLKVTEGIERRGRRRSQV